MSIIFLQFLLLSPGESSFGLCLNARLIQFLSAKLVGARALSLRMPMRMLSWSIAIAFVTVPGSPLPPRGDGSESALVI